MSTTTETTTNRAEIAQSTAIKNPTVAIAKQVHAYMKRGTLHLPPDYSADNALKSAWLALQEAKDKNDRPVLATCTQESIYNALLDMVVQGLNPAKKQMYFIAYGKSLICQRSYFGDMLLAGRVMPGIEIYFDAIYAGDEFEYSVIRGRRIITKHSQKLENRTKENLIGAYCGVVSAGGEDLGAVIMTLDEIKRSWAQSKVYKAGAGTHSEFGEQMALRTVIRKRCKPIINSSNDAMLMESVRRSEDDALEAVVDEEVAEYANQEVIDVEQEPETKALAQQTDETEAAKAVNLSAAQMTNEEDPY